MSVRVAPRAVRPWSGWPDFGPANDCLSAVCRSDACGKGRQCPGRQPKSHCTSGQSVRGRTGRCLVVHRRSKRHEVALRPHWPSAGGPGERTIKGTRQQRRNSVKGLLLLWAWLSDLFTFVGLTLRRSQPRSGPALTAIRQPNIDQSSIREPALSQLSGGKRTSRANLTSRTAVRRILQMTGLQTRQDSDHDKEAERGRGDPETKAPPCFDPSLGVVLSSDLAPNTIARIPGTKSRLTNIAMMPRVSAAVAGPSFGTE